MNNLILNNKFSSVFRTLILLHLSLLLLEISIPVCNDSPIKPISQTQIVQQTVFGIFANWIKTRENSPDSFVKTVSFNKISGDQFHKSHISVLLTDFPTEKTPVYQKHLLYTLFTASEL
ncbi:MAG: hypothetical protein HZB59_06210 [Ignavibacteriales bacterium]|nr:hypothetical protein [Ignavibacteriales bacterium]